MLHAINAGDRRRKPRPVRRTSRASGASTPLGLGLAGLNLHVIRAVAAASEPTILPCMRLRLTAIRVGSRAEAENACIPSSKPRHGCRALTASFWQKSSGWKSRGSPPHPRKKRPRRDVAKPSGAEGVSYTPPLTHPMAFGAAGVGCKIGPTVRERLVGFCQKLVRPCQPGLKLCAPEMSIVSARSGSGCAPRLVGSRTNLNMHGAAAASPICCIMQSSTPMAADHGDRRRGPHHAGVQAVRERGRISRALINPIRQRRFSHPAFLRHDRQPPVTNVSFDLNLWSMDAKRGRKQNSQSR